MATNTKNNQRVALVTGAARGIGETIAHVFASAGYYVVAIDILSDELNALADRIRASGGSCDAYTVDLADLYAVESTVEQIGESLGRIDVLVNNAATRSLHSVRGITKEAWDKVLAINITAPVFLSKWVIPWMRRTDARPHGGAIINISSVEANIPKGVAVSYAVTKGGLLSFTYDAAASLADIGIRVVALSPGAIETAFGADYGDADSGKLEADMRAHSLQVIPMGRWGTTDEIAKAVLWLASDDASFVTGTEFRVDGGLTQTWMAHDVKKQILPDEFES